VNNRFIKNGYLNHAVADAFEQLLPNGTFPSYFIMIDIDPAKIDINIHPTKTEIKFDDEKSVYAIIRAAVKRSLGKFSITPSLDFEQETAFNIPVHMYQSTPKLPGIKINPGYNPFREETVEKTTQSDFRWGQVSRPAESEMLLSGMLPLPIEPVQEEVCQVVCQYNRQYIVALYRNTFVFIDQQAAHERVLFEKNKKLLEQSPSAIQQELFPQTLTFSPDDFLIIRELLSDIGKLGFDLREFGANTIVLNGVPAGVEKGKEKEVIDHILESFKNSNHQFRNNQKENLLISVSRNLAIKSGQELSTREMQHLANELFKCDQPGFDATGSPTFVSLDSQEIEKKFQQRTR
jgi:DNA mismatch repair protein MutL